MAVISEDSQHLSALIKVPIFLPNDESLYL